MTTSTTKPVKSRYKKTDRRQTHSEKTRQDEDARKPMRRNFHISYRAVQPAAKSTVTVDTSNARNAIDVLRLCLKELKWREVSEREIASLEACLTVNR